MRKISTRTPKTHQNRNPLVLLGIMLNASLPPGTRTPAWPPRIVLGIETSCDETGLALLQLSGEGHQPSPTLLGQALHSQIDMHKAYGGVVPELASRDHLLRIVPLLRECLQQASLSLDDIDLIAVTEGPGLAGALLVGTSLAMGLGLALQRPVQPVHHLEGHLLSPLLVPGAPAEPPFVALLVSGGHTQLMQVAAIGDYTLLGETIDDAAGEAFDKSAQLLGLGYPGGPALSALAQRAAQPDRFSLPRPLLNRPGLDFSFAGLKTAVMTQVQKLRQAQTGRPDLDGRLLPEADRADLAAATERAIVEVLMAKSERALAETGLRRLVISGGVSANRLLRARLEDLTRRTGVEVSLPPPSLCTDNGVMIAWAGGLRAWRQASPPAMGGETALPIRARPRWALA